MEREKRRGGGGGELKSWERESGGGEERERRTAGMVELQGRGGWRNGAPLPPSPDLDPERTGGARRQAEREKGWGGGGGEPESWERAREREGGGGEEGREVIRRSEGERVGAAGVFSAKMPRGRVFVKIAALWNFLFLVLN